jgi:hypothetical protein
MRWERHPELDIERLLALAGCANRLWMITGADTRSIHRARAEGLTLEQADRYAVALGFHPSQLWPSWRACVADELFDQEDRDDADLAVGGAAARRAARRRWWHNNCDTANARRRVKAVL